jgi:amino-acid N-acetyltransferase
MIQVRKAVVQDLDFLFELIEKYSVDGIMLPRSKEVLLEQLPYFAVAEKDSVLIGCGSLCALSPKLVEIRSLGLSPDHKGQGVGAKLVDFLIEEATTLGFRQVMALTYESRFFERQGFVQVQKEIFPEKVWRDCIHCKKFDCCDEIAVLRTL